MKLCVGFDYDYTANVNNSDSHIEEKNNVLDADIKIAKAHKQWVNNRTSLD